MKVSCIRFIVSSRGSIARIGRQASASANATGTRMIMNRKKQPNMISAAIPGDRTEPVTSALPKMIFRSASTSSPRKTSQVTPVTGQATWMNQSGSSASSDVRRHAKRVNSIPAVDENIGSDQHAEPPEQARDGLAARRQSAAAGRPRNGSNSRTPIMAPIMIVQMNMKRAISSVQM